MDKVYERMLGGIVCKAYIHRLRRSLDLLKVLEPPITLLSPLSSSPRRFRS